MCSKRRSADSIEHTRNNRGFSASNDDCCATGDEALARDAAGAGGAILAAPCCAGAPIIMSALAAIGLACFDSQVYPVRGGRLLAPEGQVSAPVTV